MTSTPYHDASVIRRSLRRDDAVWKLVGRWSRVAVMVIAGLVLLFFFQRGLYLPIRISVVLLLALAGAGLAACRFAPLSPLTRLYIVIYTMPFAACIGYLFSDAYFWWSFETAVAYMSDPVTIQIMLMTGLIGLQGLLTGYVFAAQTSKAPRERVRATRTLKPGPFIVALVAALFFSFINTPSTTIFSAAYSAEMGIAALVNFNAAYLVAYTLLMMLVVDAEQERSRPALRQFKRGAILGTTLFILIFFQVLRGDRDSFGYLVGLAGIFLTEQLPPKAAPRIRRKRIIALGLIGGVVLVAFLALGTIRRSIAFGERVTFRQAVINGLTGESTATAVLLTNLSLAHSYRVAVMPVEHGRTYLEYLMSLPPGFITKALDIERPVENYKGPNFWFTDISAGGVHVVTVPFRNFLAPGAFFILAIFGYVIALSEIAGLRRTWLARLWYGCMFVVSAQWFWYGDIVFIREIMGFVAAAAIYAMVRRVGALSLGRASQ